MATHRPCRDAYGGIPWLSATPRSVLLDHNLPSQLHIGSLPHSVWDSCYREGWLAVIDLGSWWGPDKGHNRVVFTERHGKKLWIVMLQGIFRWADTGLVMDLISKDPTKLRDHFFDSVCNETFFGRKPISDLEDMKVRLWWRWCCMEGTESSPL